MVDRGHTKETVGLLNVNSIRGVVYKHPLRWLVVGHTKETVGLLNVNSIYLNTLFDGRSWAYQRNRGVVKCKLYTFKHPLRW